MLASSNRERNIKARSLPTLFQSACLGSSDVGVTLRKRVHLDLVQFPVLRRASRPSAISLRSSGRGCRRCGPRFAQDGAPLGSSFILPFKEQGPDPWSVGVRKGARTPHGRDKWSAATVRKAFVSQHLPFWTASEKERAEAKRQHAEWPEPSCSQRVCLSRRPFIAAI